MIKTALKALITFGLTPFRLPVRAELNQQRQIILQDIAGELQRRALGETAEYVEKYLTHVSSVESSLKLLTIGLEHVKNREGLYLEFGVCSGLTINHIAKQVDRTIYGFDSFEGLPERWRDRYGPGHFKVEALPRVRSNVTLVKGWFDKTIPRFLSEHSEDASFLHVDCDLYSSTKTVLSYCKPRIKAGTIIVFDEYFNYPGWKEGEFKAFQEFIAQECWSYEYIGYNRFHEQVCVRIKEKVH